MANRFVLPSWVIVGASFTDETSPNPEHHERWHVRSVVDDCYVVVRCKYGARWHYELWPVVKFTGDWKFVRIRQGKP